MQNFFQYFNAGGVLMWPLLACSWLALAIVIERARRLRYAALIEPQAIDDIQKLVETGDTKRAVEKHKADNALLPRVIAEALAEHTEEGGNFATIMEHTARRRLASLGNNVAVLATIAKVATLLGLLGTMFGMIAGFDALEKAGAGKAQLAGAVRLALVTTATGIMIAIPCVIAASYFRARLRRYEAQFVEIFDAVARSVKAGRGKAVVHEEDTPIPKPDVEDRFELPSILSSK